MEKYSEKVNNKGITLIALVITIIILGIVATVTINVGMNSIGTSEESKQATELNMIQHAILERYTKANLTHEDYPGELLNSDSTELSTMKDNGIELKGLDNEYYKLTKNNGLIELGITNTEDEYIVNYETGEVFNWTQKKTKSGQLLYVFARETE